MTTAMLLIESRLTCCLSVPQMKSQTGPTHLKPTDLMLSIDVLHPACKELMTDFPFETGSQIHFPKDTLFCRAW